MKITAEEFWRVIRLAYDTGHFGPVAYPNSSLAHQINADKFNLLHQYNGGPKEAPNADEQEKIRPALEQKIEDLFNGELKVTVHPGTVSFVTNTGIGFEVRA